MGKIVGIFHGITDRWVCQRIRKGRILCMEETNPESTPTRMWSLPSWQLTQSAAQASRLVAAVFADAGARGYHYRILAALDEFGAMSQTQLRRRYGIDRSDIVANGQ